MADFLPANQTFHYCPHCGVAGTAPTVRYFECAACGYRLYLNNTIAVAVLLLDTDGKMLFIRRARDPGKGKLAMPGGFVDAGEAAEDAARREVFEELGVQVGALTFLLSAPNLYSHRGIVYTVCDLFFVTRVQGITPQPAPAEVESVVWRDPTTVDLEELAFPSMRQALTRYREGL